MASSTNIDLLLTILKAGSLEAELVKAYRDAPTGTAPSEASRKVLEDRLAAARKKIEDAAI